MIGITYVEDSEYMRGSEKTWKMWKSTKLQRIRKTLSAVDGRGGRLKIKEMSNKMKLLKSAKTVRVGSSR